MEDIKPEDRLLTIMALQHLNGTHVYSNHDIKKAKALRKKMRRRRLKSERT